MQLLDFVSETKNFWLSISPHLHVLQVMTQTSLAGFVPSVAVLVREQIFAILTSSFWRNCLQVSFTSSPPLEVREKNLDLLFSIQITSSLLSLLLGLWEGSEEDAKEGTIDGTSDGEGVILGLWEGSEEDFEVGSGVTGELVGEIVGSGVIGELVGELFGAGVVGELVGADVGPGVPGELVGAVVGPEEGSLGGVHVGSTSNSYVVLPDSPIDSCLVHVVWVSG